MKIITAVVNNPLFIEIQYYTLQKYFQGEYEFIVFNDAKQFPDFTNGNDITIKTDFRRGRKCRIFVRGVTIFRHLLNKKTNSDPN